MPISQFSFKKDKFRRDRGGNSRFLNVFCEGCKGHVALYQKDGPGELKRMYIDRIHAPVVSPKKQNFVCPSCDRVIGTFFIYKKEDRPAIRLYQGAVFKKITKGVYPPQK